jgi:hypothetical protein
MLVEPMIGGVKAEIRPIPLANTPLLSVRRGVETSFKYARVAVIAYRQQEEATKAERE